jgi:hypothetical protein
MFQSFQMNNATLSDTEVSFAAAEGDDGNGYAETVGSPRGIACGRPCSSIAT